MFCLFSQFCVCTWMKHPCFWFIKSCLFNKQNNWYLCSFLLQLHAARSGHSNFSESTEEIKPLTEEEKKQQAERYVACLQAPSLPCRGDWGCCLYIHFFFVQSKWLIKKMKITGIPFYMTLLALSLPFSIWMLIFLCRLQQRLKERREQRLEQEKKVLIKLCWTL